MSVGTPGQQNIGCWLALLCTCCICPSLQQGASRTDPESLCMSRAAAHRARCPGHPPDMPTPPAGSHPGLRSKDHLSGTKSLPASRKPLTKGHPTLRCGSGADRLPPALSQPCAHSARLRVREHPACPCRSSFSHQACFPHSLVGYTPVLLQPGTWR